MFSFFQESNYKGALNRLRLKLHPAKERGEDHCCQSGFCCWTRPGALSKEDLKRLADYKGITEQEFFGKYCVVDTMGSNYTLCPILKRKHQNAGEYLSSNETYSVETPCVFLTEDNKCDVHEVKPAECKAQKCWEQSGERPEILWTREEIIALGWNENENNYDDDDDDDFYNEEEE